MSLAFVFPGQGSQAVGMLNKLAEASALVSDTYAQASAVLGFDLWDIVQNGPKEKLDNTEITQPALLAAGVACWRVWQDKSGIIPEFMAGHSLGEYTALVCAGAITFTDAVKLVSARARFMQAAVPVGEGAMAAILGLEDPVVQELCDECAQGEVLQAVNFNSPGQVVIAGSNSAVARALSVAKDKGAKLALLLPVSVPSHCQLMQPAAQQLAKEIQQVEFNAPQIKVINNVDVNIEQQADNIRDALVRQLYQPVRWVETVRTMLDQGVTHIVECGPGKVLMGLNKRIDKNIKHSVLNDTASLQELLENV